MHEKENRFIDLFAGVGGFHIGLEKAGFKCVWANEFDKYAASIYRDRFPKTEFNGADLTKVKAEWIPDFDILCGGFPCQSFSLAGKRKGFDDTRGTLFFEIARIIEAKKPRLVLLENVKGLLSHDGGFTFGKIIQTLAELRYWVEWQVLNSKDFGVPQSRERVFIIGHLRGESSRQVFPLGKDSRENNEIFKGKNQIASTVNSTYSRNQSDAQYLQEGDGLKTGAGIAWRTRTYMNQPGQYEIRKDNVANQLTTVQKDSLVIVHNMQPRSADRPSLKKNPKSGGHGHLSRKGPAYCLDRANSQAIETAPTVRAEHHNTADVHFIAKQKSIRRLTPKECERLQGFPDRWTLNKLISLQKDMADNQRYKMMGNAVTVNVIEAIGKKILEVGA